jgi:hypothetical protein
LYDEQEKSNWDLEPIPEPFNSLISHALQVVLG